MIFKRGEKNLMKDEELETKLEVDVLNDKKAKNEMIYYCIHEDECSYKKCSYHKTNSKFSTGDPHKNLTIDGFDCVMVGRKRVILVSDERIICNKYRECNINCFLKTTYVTNNNLRRYFGYKASLLKPFICRDTNQTINFMLAGENIGNYVSIWN